MKAESNQPASEGSGPVIQYWFSVASPWTWLGSARFIKLVRANYAQVEVLPMELGDIFAATGGRPFAERPAARKTYRQLELARWSKHLNIPLTLEPRFYPVDRSPASCLVIAARNVAPVAAPVAAPDVAQRADNDALPLTHAILRAIWAEDRNIANWPTLAAIANDVGLDGNALVEIAQQPATAEQYRRNTERAIAAQVFGAPTYVIDGERFWGQDRLGFLAERVQSL